MDAASYKDLTTSRGFKYHYYRAVARDSQPTLLFLHGYPSTSRDWRYQAASFSKNGYGLIIPDMLGYGGTAKPTNVEAYGWSLVVNDIVDILDEEGIQTFIVVAHDW